MKKEDLMNIDTRSIVLKLMYENIPGIKDASLETKNFIYDTIKERLENLK